MKSIKACPTLFDVYGPGVVYNGYVHPEFCRWLPDSQSWRDGSSAYALSIAGDMPTLCHEASAVPESIALLYDAGLDIHGEIHTYSDHRSYQRQLQSLGRAGWTFMQQYAQPADEADPAMDWIDRRIVAHLNNKCALAEFVPPEHVPERVLVPPGELADTPIPCVIKACTAQSSGGGVDVHICHDAEDLEAARQYFRDCDRVVVEEWLDIAANLCLNYAVIGPDDVRYLGVAEQIVDENADFQGNWVAPEIKAPAAAVRTGSEIVRKAALGGYRGIAGIDVAILADESMRIFDLNFRINASTRVILLQESIAARFGVRVMKAVALSMAAPFERFLSVVRDTLGSGQFLPLSIFNPVVAGYPAGTENRVGGVMLGSSREEVEERRAALAQKGLVAK